MMNEYRTSDDPVLLNGHANAEAPPRLLLVADEPRLLASLYELLKGRGFVLATPGSGTEAIAHLSRSRFDLVLLDLCLPDIGAHEIMDFMNERDIDADVIVVSGKVGIDAAIGALKRGAYDYLRKPTAAFFNMSCSSVTRLSSAFRRRISSDCASTALRCFRHAVALRPDVQAIEAHLKPFRYFACSMTTLHHLLDCCDLEFFCVPLSTHTFSLSP